MGYALPTRVRPAGPAGVPAVIRAVSALQIRHSCPDCGESCFPRRKAARAVARLLYPGRHMRAYRCGIYWHLRPGNARTAS